MGLTILSTRFIASTRDALRRVTPLSVRRSAQPVIRRILERRIAAALRAGEATPEPGPLVVSGLLQEAKGVSQGARLSVAAFQAAGLSPISHDLRPLFSRGASQAAGFPTHEPGGVWFVHVNAPEAIHALGRISPDSWRNRYRIAYWAYELARVPDEWVRASQAFHEIWAPSAFVVEALKASGVTTPVRLMPHPVALGLPAENLEARTSADFTILTLGDLHSSAARKNLIGAINIYTHAFPTPGQARLIVKVREDAAHPAFLAQARHVARGRTDIQFLTGDLTTNEMHQLIASSGLVLSPHRAEGFGLPLAEALLAGVPVLATGWSGNVDFMAGLPELSIKYSLVPVRDAHRIYRARGQQWAEPDMQDAVEKLRALAASPDLRSRLAARGRSAIEALSLPWSRETLLAMPIGAFIKDVAVHPVAGAGPSS